jgi:hypothetical protein
MPCSKYRKIYYGRTKIEYRIPFSTGSAVNAMRENIKKRQSHDDPAFSKREPND